MNKTNGLSVVIVTRNRYGQLKQCLEALAQSKFVNLEVIVIDQSDAQKSDSSFQQFSKKFSFFYLEKSNQIGKSRGLNRGLKLVSNRFVAFTDDDCIVTWNWAQNILKTLNDKPDIVGVFGRTLPYQSEAHPNQICPSIFERTTQAVITEPAEHWSEIGFGNNMAFRKEFFVTTGGFKEWLGPGSIGSNAEDAELALRALTLGEKLFANSKMIVFHDRWLTLPQYQKQELSYICGEIACYGYFALKGSKLALSVIRTNLVFSILEGKEAMRSIIHFRRNGFYLLILFFIKAAYKLRGICVAFIFCLPTYRSV